MRVTVELGARLGQCATEAAEDVVAQDGVRVAELVLRVLLSSLDEREDLRRRRGGGKGRGRGVSGRELDVACRFAGQS